MRFVWGIKGAESLVTLHPRGEKVRINPLAPGTFTVTLRVAAQGSDQSGGRTDVYSQPAELTVTVHPKEKAPKSLALDVTKYWSSQRDEALRSSLKTARTAASAWQGAVTAGLGVVVPSGSSLRPRK